LKHLSIESEIAFSKNQKDIAQNISMKEKGKYELILQKNMNYHFSFSAIGYKSFDVFFVTTDSLRSFTNEVYLSPLKEGENFVMDKIYFQPNTYHLKEGAQEEIDKLFSYLKANPATSIEIQGHTNGNKRIKGSYKSDFKGSAKKLSQFRADKIKKYLVDKGIPEDRLSAIGYGGSKPIFSSPKNQAQANKNIRVEILILSQKESLSAQKKSR
jgi:outer membrane protein OmpA-like peptidoglycan-associated protein